MTYEQMLVIDYALKVLSKPDWSYNHDKDRTSITLDDVAVETIFRAIYGYPIDRNANGVHWLARAAILHAISHVGFFKPKTSVWTILFYIYSVVSTVVWLAAGWYLSIHPQR